MDWKGFDWDGDGYVDQKAIPFEFWFENAKGGYQMRSKQNTNAMRYVTYGFAVVLFTLMGAFIGLIISGNYWDEISIGTIAVGGIIGGVIGSVIGIAFIFMIIKLVDWGISRESNKS